MKNTRGWIKGCKQIKQEKKYLKGRNKGIDKEERQKVSNININGLLKNTNNH